MGNESIQDVIVEDIAAEKRNALVGGPFGSNLVSRDYVECGVPVIRGQNMGSGRWVSGEFVYVSEDKAHSLSANLALAGDIVFTQRGTLGQVAIIPDNGRHKKYVISQSQMKLSPDLEKVDPLYLYYEFTGPHQLAYIANNAIQTGVPHTNLTILRNTPLTLPPLPEQKAIAHILGTLDDKIELNRQMNATLEAMAQALFKSWFVDFDPVIDNAIKAGNPIPDELAPRAEVRRQALANGTAQQSSVDHPALGDPKPHFPAAFQYTEELGWTPEGWEVGCVADLAELNPESWTAKNHPDSITYVDLANTKNGRINETTVHEFGEAPSRARRVLKPHDTILGTVRPGNRSFAYVHEYGLTGSTGFAVLRANDTASRSFLYLALTRDETIEVFAHLADGAAYPAIRAEVVGNTQVPIPSSAVLQVFEDKAAPLIAKAGQNQRKAETLSKLRDVLLPKLISGQLRMPEAEQLTKEALA